MRLDDRCRCCCLGDDEHQIAGGRPKYTKLNSNRRQSAKLLDEETRKDKLKTKTTTSRRSRMKRMTRKLLKWPLIHCCLPLFQLTLIISISLLGVQSHRADCLQLPGGLISSRQTQHEGTQHAPKVGPGREEPNRQKRSPWAPTAAMAPSLVAANELRVSGSKSEPPSRPTVDWSKQRPHFGQDMQRNVSVELGKTAYLTCKVFDLGDKTVSWLRPRENEILTAGRYTYIGDPRFVPLNDNGSHDWILQINDVSLNDSTNYECQVSTDPKMSTIINLQVKAAKSRIKQGEQYYASLHANIEFTCEILQPTARLQPSPSSVQQTYWYHNGNLINYVKTMSQYNNFSIEWDSSSQISRLKLFNIQPSDSGNYTCKPTSAEPSTIRLHVKRPSRSSSKDRVHYSGGYHMANTKEAPRNRQHYGMADGLADSSGGCCPSTSPSPINSFLLSMMLTSCLMYINNLFIFYH